MNYYQMFVDVDLYTIDVVVLQKQNTVVFAKL